MMVARLGPMKRIANTRPAIAELSRVGEMQWRAVADRLHHGLRERAVVG